MIFIGICGASGSGKSTLARELTNDVRASVVVLQQDSYYVNHPDMTFEERARLNYDEPGIFDHDALYEDVCSLLAGQPIRKKAYDFALHARCDTDEIIQPADVLILEGIHSFYDKRLLQKMFLKLYVSVDPDICLLRRIQRDILERGRDINSIAEQYTSTVKPMYDKYIRNYVADADVVVMRGGKNARIVEILNGYIRSVLGEES
ncbi:MAG: uridine kinase [Clostridia bacterium]|nr:uridine kinase [Clostridia bacterium]